MGFLFLLFYSLLGNSQPTGRYFVRFADKHNSGFSLDDPLKFLSLRAIERRIKQNIDFDFYDLPVSEYYVNIIKSEGIPVTNKSKWLNGIVTGDISSTQAEWINQQSFVHEIKLIKPSIPEFKQQVPPAIQEEDTLNTYYGLGQRQITINHGEFLHELGYLGNGMQIAVIDAGFSNVDTLRPFRELWERGRILGTRDFVDPSSDLLFRGHGHGTLVLSIMAVNIPGVFVGTAPGASYWLLRSEDTGSEYPIEEYFWAEAAEFADSAGADIINSSLGYSTFTDSIFNHTYQDMNGNTTAVTTAADIASSKGMLVVVSAGNLGDDPWKYIFFSC
ncbi:MAG: S8 family serine peptidase [Bacteroidales bacterium]|nr:S8 family serine peptidase [Bacteroidales bacterium]